MSTLLFIEKVPDDREQFAARVQEIARRFKFNPNWLMGVMNSETGGTFRADQKNLAGSGATGLIQFMPSTARRMGTTTDELAKLTPTEQLDWVEKYLEMTLNDQVRAGRLSSPQPNSFADLYLIVFYPAAIGKPDDWSFPSSIYSQNKGVDMNADGTITIADFKAFIKRKIPADRLAEFTNRYWWLAPKYLVFGGIMLAIGLLAWLYATGRLKLPQSAPAWKPAIA